MMLGSKIKQAFSSVLAAAMMFTGIAATAGTPVHAEGNEQTVVNTDTTWQYRDDDQVPAEGWQTSEVVSETQWQQAKGSFGAKKGALGSLSGGFTPKTLLNQYKDGTETDIPMFYFRTTFDVADPDTWTTIEGDFYYDDAVTLFINGQRLAGGADTEFDEQGYGGTNDGAPNHETFKVSDLTKFNLKRSGNVLSAVLHNGRPESSDIYLDIPSIVLKKGEVPEVPETPAVQIKNLVLGIGSTEAERNINWLSSAKETEVLQYTIMPTGWEDGASFPTDATTVEAQGADSGFAGFYSYKANMTGLQSDTSYIYRVGKEGAWSDVYSFTTSRMGTGLEFSFLLAGDPQIGASGNIDNDKTNWNTSLRNAVDALPGTDFLLSAGDQVNSKTVNDQYDAFYSPDQLRTMTFATNVGNHDNGDRRYSDSNNVPNVSTNGVTSNTGDMSGDYWFTYNGVLFMNLNSNERSTAAHKAFMEDAIANNPQAVWKVVTFHHAIYSMANHYTDSDIQQRRAELPQVFSELGVDVVLMGHDHYFTRTAMMNGGNVASDNVKGAASITDPAKGDVLYLTANSASGSKYYQLNGQLANGTPEWCEASDQSRRTMLTNVTVNGGSMTLDTYYTDKAGLEKMDSFTINKQLPEGIVIPAEIKNINLNIGSDEGQRNLNWMSSLQETEQVRYGEKASFETTAHTVDVQGAECAVDGMYAYKAVMTDLKPETEYSYCVGKDGNWSPTYSFTTGRMGEGEKFNFLFAGDPQIGAGKNGNAVDAESWRASVANAMAILPDTSFLLSAGDQVNKNANDEQYEGFLSPEAFRSTALAVNVGNHDNKNARYTDYYNMPNVSSKGATAGTGAGSGDYWFTYNGVLFMNLNSNNMSTAEHKAFMQEAIANNPNAKWKIVSFHHAIYSMAGHYTDSDIQQRRAELPQVFSELGVDVVLMGHDHYFTRTAMMNGGNVASDNVKGAASITDPANGDVLYLTANSASGSKYYDLNAQFATGKPEWDEADDQSARPSMTNVTVDGDVLTLDTYYTDKTGLEKMDSFTIDKSERPQQPTPTNKPTEKPTKPTEKPAKPMETAKPSTDKKPSTGVDGTPLAVYGGMLAVAGAALVLLLKK